MQCEKLIQRVNDAVNAAKGDEIKDLMERQSDAVSYFFTLMSELDICLDDIHIFIGPFYTLRAKICNKYFIDISYRRKWFKRIPSITPFLCEWEFTNVSHLYYCEQ